jgi:hypothetical protein
VIGNETLAAFELAHLGFYTASPQEVQQHTARLTEEFGVTRIAELVDHLDKGTRECGRDRDQFAHSVDEEGRRNGPAEAGTRDGRHRGSRMPASVRPTCGRDTGAELPLREGAFVVTRGRLAGPRKSPLRHGSAIPVEWVDRVPFKHSDEEVVRMRGRQDQQVSLLAFIDVESRIPLDHPLRTIKYIADEALAELSPMFDDRYAEIGRPSIPPERLLKASLRGGAKAASADVAPLETADVDVQRADIASVNLFTERDFLFLFLFPFLLVQDFNRQT